MTAVARTTRVEIAGIPVEITEAGQGLPLLFLHGGHPSGRLDPQARIVEALSEKFHFIAPTHPGFGTTAAPPQLTNIDDLAYVYLDLLDALDLRDVVVVGASLGGWIAAEIAVKTTERISRLVLTDSVGIKVGDRETRDIADIYAITDRQLAEIAYADPQKMARDTKSLPEEELIQMARSREATGRYAWSPYMHNPKLKARLHRIRVPALVLWGEADRIVSPEYGRAYAAALPDARFAAIESAGHFPHLEQPNAVAHHILDFVSETSAGRSR
jgi:pimeloyl-ACP methyl ester carboxylesterase